VSLARQAFSVPGAQRLRCHATLEPFVLRTRRSQLCVRAGRTVRPTRLRPCCALLVKFRRSARAQSAIALCLRCMLAPLQDMGRRHSRALRMELARMPFFFLHGLSPSIRRAQFMWRTVAIKPFVAFHLREVHRRRKCARGQCMCMPSPILTNVCIMSWARNPVVSSFAGAGQNGAKDGQGTMASFVNPSGITVDLSGQVYVCDASDSMYPMSMIRVISPTGGSKDVFFLIADMLLRCTSIAMYLWMYDRWRVLR
jgi:hypothetical protein